MKNKGFTLIELVLVLVILAIVTNVAMVHMLDTVKSKKHEQAEKELKAITEAVVGTELGAAESFVGTMGRLPYALSVVLEGKDSATDRTAYAATELVAQGMLPAYKQIVLADKVASERSSLSPAYDNEMDSLVRLGVGWRGPYIKSVAANATESGVLFDAWGNVMSAPDAALLNGRIVDVNSNAVVSAGVEVGGMVHFGADARPDNFVAPKNVAERDGVAMFNAYADLPAEFELQSASGAAVPVDALTGGGLFVARIYLPYIEDNVAKIKIVEQDPATTPVSNCIQFDFSKIPVGTYPLVVKYKPTGRVWYQTIELTPLPNGQSTYQTYRLKITIPSTLITQ